MPSLDPRIIVALDFPDERLALEFVSSIDSTSCKLKIGKELFTRAGPQLVEKLVKRGFSVFLDLKFHDIPTTVKKAVYAASQLGIWMINVHALGSESMLIAAREGVEMAGSNRPFLIAVSVLTSMTNADLKLIGIELEVPELVDRLARLTLQSGLDGLVCSAQETEKLRKDFGNQPLLVTPGIRPVWSASDDQKRIVTPEQAIANGSSYLVIGRPITTHKNPAQALESINNSI